MNFSVIGGFFASVGVILYAATTGVQNSFIFMSLHALVIVLGGTVAASLICFPLSHFRGLARVFFRTLSGKQRAMIFETIGEIIQLAQVAHNGGTFSEEIPRIKNPFLRESMALLEQGGLSDQELDEILHTRVEFQNEKYKRDGMTFKIIGKFPPAFGLVGTTVGMISLLQGVGQANAFEQIGPAMSLSLVATFYGLIAANFFLIPLGENLSQSSEEDLVMRRMVVEGVRLLREQRHPLLVSEALKSYLTPTDREKMESARAA